MSNRESLWGDNSPIESHFGFSVAAVIVFPIYFITGILLSDTTDFYIGLGASAIFGCVLAILYVFKPESRVFFIKFLLLSFMGFLFIVLGFSYWNATLDSELDYTARDINTTIENYAQLLDGPCADFEQYVLENLSDQYAVKQYIENCPR